MVGVDEAGRGPLAGPVVAAAGVLCKPCPGGLDDSKKLSAKRRAALEPQIRERCAWGLAVIEPAEIDRLNIFHATMRAMTLAVARLVETLGCEPETVLIDGNMTPHGRQSDWRWADARAIVGGDGKERCIGAASILAKEYRDRLMREAETNVAIRVTEADDKDSFEVAGRGELQLGVLIETMRREGFELGISRPRVLFKEENGQRMEPYETVVIDVDDEFSGTVVEKMQRRKAELTEMRPSGQGKTRITFSAPSRGLIGYHGEFLSDTRGTGIMNRLFEKYDTYRGPIEGRQNGVLISMVPGEAVPYALNAREERGELFIRGGAKIYEGMIIGENAKPDDLEVNPMKSKQLTNFRSTGKDDAIRLTPPRVMTLEQAIAYIDDDEMVEVTPENIRLRKAILDPHERKRAKRAAQG